MTKIHLDIKIYNYIIFSHSNYWITSLNLVMIIHHLYNHFSSYIDLINNNKLPNINDSKTF